MKTTSFAFLSTVLLAGITSVRAHGHVVSWIVNGQSKAGFNPYWTSELGPTAERPTDNYDEGWADYWSPIVACGGLSAPSSVLTWDVDAGSTVTANWDEWDWGHRGPVLEYMAACPASGCSGVEAASLNWFKISESGWDGKQFASETITRTRSWSFKIPSEIASGNYLVRHEIIAMHRPGEPQVYPVCFQANVKSSGTLKPADTVKFPAAYNMNDNFKRFNLYWGDDFNQFKSPGPAVFDRSAAAPAPAPAPVPAPSPSRAASSAVPSFSTQPILIVPPSESSSPSAVGGVATSSVAPVPETTKAPGRCKRRIRRSRVVKRHS